MLRAALEFGILDTPNHRSSHSSPTPRGGGVAIAGAFFAGVLAWVWVTPVGMRPYAGILGGALATAIVGWIDDVRGVPARYRASVHLVSAVWAVTWLRDRADLFTSTHDPLVTTLSALFAVGVIAWGTNLFNFMDGIDGLAGSQALTAGVFGGALLILNGDLNLGVLALILGASAGGFLYWNWRPAKIFMGDVGSGMLGFALFAIACASEVSGSLPLFIWLALLAPFVLDATVTLARRVLRRERWYLAHRQHAYQRLVDSGTSHARATSWLLLMNVLVGTGFIVTRGDRRFEHAIAGLAYVASIAAYVAIERRAPTRRLARRL